MKQTILALLFLLPGCAVLSDRRTVAGCQVADGVTTYIALKKGAVELNSIFSNWSPQGILLFKLFLAYTVYKALPDAERATGSDKFAMGIASAVGCIPAVSNIGVINKLP